MNDIPLSPALAQVQRRTRRHFLEGLSGGMGTAALASLLSSDGQPASAAATTNPMAAHPGHFPGRAKRMISIHLTGGPPQMDLFDPKPVLTKRSGEDCPAEAIAGKRFAFTRGTPKLLGTTQSFAQYGESGIWMSDAIPQLHRVADELCVLRSMNSDQFNHAPAELFVYTGSPRPGRPSLGSWVTYGLGSENNDLPGYVVLMSSGTLPNAGVNSFGSGFLPTVYQGVQCRSKGDPVLYASDPAGMTRAVRRDMLDCVNDLNNLQSHVFGHPETATRIAQYEMAFRMQASVPEVMDIRREPKHVLDAYGVAPGKESLANNCLLARRLVEQGVRFVQLFDWGWDFHGTKPETMLGTPLVTKCATMDRPVAALIEDLRARGLLDDTLVMIGGEFGRTPFRENSRGDTVLMGRDHYPDCFTTILVGGGVKRGFVWGETDELGFSIVRDPVHVHDLQATVLHLLGFDHERLTYRFQGRDFRLTDVHGHVVRELLA